MAYFFISVGLALIAMCLNIIMLSFIIHLTNGLINNDFQIVKDLKICRIIYHAFPRLFVSSSSLFILLALVTYATAFLKNVSSYAASLSIWKFALQTSSKIKRLIFSRYLSFGKMYFDNNNMGYLNYILTNFSTEVPGLIKSLHVTLSQTFMLFAYLFIMCKISWKLTIIVFVTLSIAGFFLKKIVEHLKAKSPAFTKAQIGISNSIFNILSCMLLVKSYALEEQESRRFAEISDREAKLSLGMAKKIQLMEPIEDMTVITVMVIVATVTGFLVSKDPSFKVANIFVFLYLVRNSIPAFNSINTYRVALAKAKGPIIDLMKILNDNNKYFVICGNREFTGLRNSIEFCNLSFSYVKGITALKGLTFSIDKGKTTAIVGPTGAGKTTLLNLIMRFYDCPPSSIRMDGIDIRDFTLKSLMPHIAMVSQDVLLLSDTIRNNIIYGVDGESITEEKLIYVAQKARLYDFITQLPDKFDTLVGDRGIKLSGGEKQRISIARALLKDSEILILDEATSSLDTKTERLIQQAIEEATRGRTTIVVAHRLSTIKHADKIVVIEGGRLIEEGPLNELVAREGHFYLYWEAQKFY